MLTLMLMLIVTCKSESPNIVFIMADDMGPGDVAYNGGKAKTPGIDRLAKEGMKFTDVHTTSSLCTPSRYGLLTGRYNWRSRLQSGVFYDPLEEPLIKKDEETVATMLRDNGYNTACIGKWHLGMQWQLKNHTVKDKNRYGSGWEIDYSLPASIAPTSHGFDYFHGIQASLDMPPYVYIENNTALGSVTSTKAFLLRKGAAAKDFEAVHCLKHWAAKSAEYIENISRSQKPFFLYLALTSPHTPILPSQQWIGKSRMGTYGDFLMETDWVVGEVLKTLDRLHIANNTMVVFTTDNGAAPKAFTPRLFQSGHHPCAQFRGYKGEIWEGGHRVPTVIRWPSKIKNGASSSRTITLADFFATYSEMLGVTIKESSAVDSISFYRELVDLPHKNNRSAIVMHAGDGKFAIRNENMKLCFSRDNNNRWNKSSSHNKWQLYDLAKDHRERNNIYEDHPTLVKELYTLMLQYIENGRSTDGSIQENDAHINLLKDDANKDKGKSQKKGKDNTIERSPLYGKR